MIIISYFINNCVSGVVYDVYINYLQEIDIDIAKSFWGYYGYSMFISAFIITFINKIGYKKILFLSVGSCSIGLFGTFLLQSGFFMTTYLGGYATIEFFSRVTNRTYLEAKELSNSLDTMDSLLKSLYVTSMGRVILLLGIISLLGIIPLFFIKENREDYSEIREGNKNFVKDIFNKRREIFNRHSVLYLIYWGLNNFAIGLFVPYYTIYFNRYLNIDKVTTSLLLSLSYIAVVLFMFFTDTIAKLIGKVKILYLSILLAIPFMILVAEGNRFGDSRIWIIGVALFIRTGIMNLGSPIDSSLAVEVVNEKMVPLYTGIISFITGIAGVLSGQFTGKILFDLPNGYKLGYYLGAGLYFIGALIIATNFSRFNKIKGE